MTDRASTSAGATPPGTPRYTLHESLKWQRFRAPDRKPGEPSHRALRIYALDPSLLRSDGAVSTIRIPYEPLEPGPAGGWLVVDSSDDTGFRMRSAMLDSPHVLASDGYAPSPSDPRFHQQMVYAVCSHVLASFRVALGRTVDWAFGSPERVERLKVFPHAGPPSNASYEREGQAIRFGFVRKQGSCGCVFTSLSHDVIAHEMTHALLDGLRPYFLEPVGPDTLAFHEAFADLVAIFQHFGHPPIVEAALRRQRGQIDHRSLMGQLAHEFGYTLQGGPLRTVLEADPSNPRCYDATAEPHELGSVLVNAVFEAFSALFRRKTARLMRLATGGTGVLPAGEPPHDLLAALGEAAAKLAEQVLRICVRAIDYCPPAGLNFGDYLRAMITADEDLMPDDPWDYRGELIRAFERRGIAPRNVPNLSEDALRWSSPDWARLRIDALDFSKLRFDGDPANPAAPEELARRACVLGEFATRCGHLDCFGLARAGDARLGGDDVDLPQVRSIRTARRAGEQGQVLFDLVCEITQTRRVRADGRRPGFVYTRGSTVIVRPDGTVRYVIAKPVTSGDSRERRRAFIEGPGSRWWRVEGEQARPAVRLLCVARAPAHAARD